MRALSILTGTVRPRHSTSLIVAACLVLACVIKVWEAQENNNKKKTIIVSQRIFYFVLDYIFSEITGRYYYILPMIILETIALILNASADMHADWLLLHIYLQLFSHHSSSTSSQSHLHQVIDGVLVTCSQGGESSYIVCKELDFWTIIFQLNSIFALVMLFNNNQYCRRSSGCLVISLQPAGSTEWPAPRWKHLLVSHR